MREYVYLSEQGDDKYSGLSEKTAVRSVARAIKIATRTGLDIKVLGEVKRLTEDLERELASSDSFTRAFCLSVMSFPGRRFTASS